MCLIGNMELLCMQCRGIWPHLAARGKSHGFSLVSAENWGIFTSPHGDYPSKLVFVQQCQASCLVTKDTSGISWRLRSAMQMLLEVMHEAQCTFLVPTVILGFLSIFNNCQASSPFEALNSTCLSRCQTDMRPPVQMRQGPRDFSRVSTGDSDIPSPCEMKDEPAFKPLQGNPAFFRVRASRCPFHLRQQTQGPFHMPIAGGSLLLRCWWKVGLLFSRSQGVTSHLETIWVHEAFLEFLC